MGTVDIYHSRRTYYAECKYWTRDERIQMNINEWVLKTVPSGTFYAKEISPKTNQSNQIANSFMFDRNIITLESDDDISDITKGDIVLYNRTAWIVVDVQSIIHRKESEFNDETDYKYVVSLRGQKQ